MLIMVAALIADYIFNNVWKQRAINHTFKASWLPNYTFRYN